MIYHGHVQEVTDKTMGDELVTATASGATTLVVNDVADFDEDGGFLAINGAVLEYASCDDDTDTITLLDPLPAAAEASDRVDLWDLDNAKPVISYVALVAVDGMDQGDPLEVTVDHQLATMLRKAIRINGGESVTVERDGIELSIAKVHGKVAQVDATANYVPAFAGAKGDDDAIAHSTWTFLGGWFTLQDDRIKADPFGTQMTVEVDGVYDIRVGVTFAAAAGGYRAVRMRYYNNTDGGEIGVSRQVRIPGSSSEDVSVTVVETAQYRAMHAGDSVRFEAWQSSGAALAVKGSNVFTGPPSTDCAIRWVGPL